MARKPTKGELDWLRRRQKSGGSLSQTSLNMLAENTPGAVVAGGNRVKNGPMRNQQPGGLGSGGIRRFGTLADAREAAERERGTTTTHPSGFEGGQGKPADTSGQQPGRKRTTLPTDSDGINETRYMREAREKMRTPVQDKLRRAEQLLEKWKGTDRYDALKARVDAMRKKYGDVPEGVSLPSGYGRAMTKNGSFAFHSDGNGGLKSGLPHWGEDATRAAETVRRRRIMDSIEANRREGLAAGARVRENFGKFSGSMDDVASGRSKLDPAGTVQAMKDIMRDAQTNVGMTDRKFSSGQGFSKKNRQKLDDFAGTLVDKAVGAVKSNIDKTYKHEQSAEALRLGGAIGRVNYETTKGQEQADLAELNIISKPGQSNVNDAAEITIHATELAKDTKALTQALRAYNEKNKAERATNSKYFAEVQADIDKAKFALGREASPRVGPVGPVDKNGKSRQENRLYQEMLAKQRELWNRKKRQGQADWGGGISERARRFIDRRRSEVVQTLEGATQQAAFYGGLTDPKFEIRVPPGRNTDPNFEIRVPEATKPYPPVLDRLDRLDRWGQLAPRRPGERTGDYLQALPARPGERTGDYLQALPDRVIKNVDESWRRRVLNERWFNHG